MNFHPDDACRALKSGRLSVSGVSRKPETLMVSGLQLGLLGGSRCSEGGRGFFRLPLMGGLGRLGGDSIALKEDPKKGPKKGP